MNRCISFAGFVAVAIAFIISSSVQAAESTKASAHSAKLKSVGAAKSKKATKPKTQKPGAAACPYNGHAWGEGKHCVKACNEQGTLCDMQICKKGQWKNYSSCFGSKAVAPNCPPACE